MWRGRLHNFFTPSLHDAGGRLSGLNSSRTPNVFIRQGGLAMARPRRDLVDEILKVRAAIIQAVSAATAPAWMHLELTMSQMNGLRTPAYHGPATVSLIAQTLRIGLPTASQLVDRLRQAGIAERARVPRERRRTLVRLMKEGPPPPARPNQG